ncbi:hypothetical protein A3L11_04315 [Thermococcus siculi]|uniref:Uncharacterized protein n=1 Tax=Thermococcus siculi TaxID=72803 RepID=A0A2Z2MRS9_9EURY|nr:hypothetical protein [Thermococcus siculi]ASJ08496.1 hypothetical protein A3L11_04315 [Thermococcus siculi]
MRLEQALDEYDRRREKARKGAEKIRKKYQKRLEKKVKEILKRIDELEKRKIPKDVDDNIKKIVSAERRNYILALRNALASVGDMEALGKRLPDLAKLHVGHGKYLLIIFEKDVYAINRLLKELNEEYISYYNELAEKGLEELDIRETLREIETTKGEISSIEAEIEGLKEELKGHRERVKKFYEDAGLPELEERIKELSSRVRSEEMEVRSKASKLQKPVKRMRLHEPLAEELVRDSSVALRKPGEFMEFVKRIEPKLDAKGKKAARWLEENLEEKARRIGEERKELEGLERKRDEILEKGRGLEEEIHRLMRLIEDREAELRKLKNRLEHLEKELDESIAKLEKILGTKIER